MSVVKKTIKSNIFIGILIVFMLLGSGILPVVIADKVDIKGFDKGPSYESVVPMKRVTFVNFDENSYLDDYAYLAAVPTAVFNDGSKLFSNPLLFYQDEYPVKDVKDRSLNARQGLDYFMQDWMSYCNGQLDQMTLINVPKSKLDPSWKAKEYTTINADNPYDIASQIALNDWSYSDNAVVSVIDNNSKKPDVTTNGKVSGSISADLKTKSLSFFVAQTNKLNPQFAEFNVPEGYKYIKVGTWFPGIAYMISNFEWIAIPAGDKDLQLYCKYDDNWMMVDAKAANTNQWGPNSDAERIGAYVYKSGSWRVGITDFPTKGVTTESASNKHLFKYGTWPQIFSALRKGVKYQTDITMFPGTMVKIPDNPPFECNNVKLKLTWNDPSVNLGFSLIGPAGEVVHSEANESRSGYQEMSLDELGQCLPGENYSICVYTMGDIGSPVDFNVKYSWGQRISQSEGDALASATEGSVLASLLNAPLLYASPSQLTQKSIDTLYKLGIKNVYLVDIGNHLSSDVRNKINDIANIKECYNKLDQTYKAIMSITNKNDVIFTTIDPWTYWWAGKPNVPAGEYPGALFVGPAAYCAAQHGSPVIIVDCEPQLSSAVVWHNEFWKRYASDRLNVEPAASEMYLTGTRVYDFLKENGFDKPGLETMVTVADQYDIGASWDRVFPGKATPGRIWGSPVDTAYWISHNVFYPALIFLNPGTDPGGVTLINGSVSHRRSLLAWGKFGLKIDRPSQEATYTYPMLNTYTSYCYRFNQNAIKYYGTKYQTADGIIPGETNSLNAIDDGVNLKSTGEAGAFYPDINPSEVVPFYASKGGYSSVFSTSFDAVMNDLNKGVLIWTKSGHGGSGLGAVTFWDTPDTLKGILGLAGAKKEANPWRGYEVYLGSTTMPDTMTMDVHGIIPSLIGDPNHNGIFRTGVDWAPAVKPILDKLSNLLSKIPIIKRLTPAWLKDTKDYEDGFINSVVFGYVPQHFYNATQFDEALGNIHSVGINMGDCTPMGTYLHLTLVRHGSIYQITDPWATSWYADIWMQSVPRDIILGDTVGQAYTKGISHAGILYITDPPQPWWDAAENVCLYGDPSLRVYVPSTQYSDANHWEQADTMPLRYSSEVSVDGHMPFGVTSYPNERTPTTFWQQYIWIIVALIVIVILVIAAIAFGRKKK